MRNERPAGSPGYTFPLMLIIVAAMAFGAARLDLAQSYRLKRDKEAELLFRGLAYKRAIKAYYSKNGRYPRQLKELADDRDSSKPRFMRQLYKDPITGGDFKLILGSEGAIIGVVSASRDVPFKTVDFDKELEDFGDAKTYADWKFVPKRGRGTPPPGIPPGAISPPRMGNPL
jgi:hypothetical protein